MTVYCPNSFIKHYMLSAFLSTSQITLKNSIMLLNTPSLFFPKHIYRLSHIHTHTHTHTTGRKSSPIIIAVYLFSRRKNTVLTSFHFHYLFQRSRRKPSSDNLLGVRTGRNIRNCITLFLISGVRNTEIQSNSSITYPIMGPSH